MRVKGLFVNELTLFNLQFSIDEFSEKRSNLIFSILRVSLMIEYILVTKWMKFYDFSYILVVSSNWLNMFLRSLWVIVPWYLFLVEIIQSLILILIFSMILNDPKATIYVKRARTLYVSGVFQEDIYFLQIFFSRYSWCQQYYYCQYWNAKIHGMSFWLCW